MRLHRSLMISTPYTHHEVGDHGLRTSKRLLRWLAAAWVGLGAWPIDHGRRDGRAGNGAHRWRSISMLMCSASAPRHGRRRETSSSHSYACACATRSTMSTEVMCESLNGSVERAPRHAHMRGKLLVRAVHVCAMDLQGLSLLGQRMFPSSEPLTRGGSVMWPCNDVVSTSRCGRQSRLHRISILRR